MSKKKINIDSIKGKPEFKAPDGYFDKLPGIIESRIAEMEGEEEFILNSEIFKKELPFTVPDGYFSDLPLTIQARTNEPTPTRSVVFARPQLAWSVPVLIVLFFVGYNFFFSSGDQGLNTDQMLAEISTQDLIAYLEVSDMTTEELLEGVDITLIAEDFNESEDVMFGDMEISEDELNDLFDEYDPSGEIL